MLKLSFGIEFNDLKNLQIEHNLEETTLNRPQSLLVVLKRTDRKTNLRIKVSDLKTR